MVWWWQTGRAGCRAADRVVRRGGRPDRGVRLGSCGGVDGPWGWRGERDAAGLPVAALMAAASALSPAPPAAIGLLLATSLATMDEGAGVAWRLPRGAGGLCGSGGAGGRRCEADRLWEVRLLASRA